MTKGEPETPEDKLVKAYWEENGKGPMYLEVPIGSRIVDRFPTGTVVRRIDAVRVLSNDLQEDKIVKAGSYKVRDLVEIFSGAEVEVIEAKMKLNRVVFGQAVAGTELFEKQYQPRIVHPVVIYERHDPAMEWVCRKYGVRTWQRT